MYFFALHQLAQHESILLVSQVDNYTQLQSKPEALLKAKQTQGKFLSVYRKCNNAEASNSWNEGARNRKLFNTELFI